jgi:periodic tryptophan protein 1
VLNFDARTLPTDLNSPSPARYTLSAHDGAVSALDISPHIRGCVVTGGTDKMVKVWNVADGDGGKPSVSMVASRDLGVVGLSPDIGVHADTDAGCTGQSFLNGLLAR